MKDPRHEKDLEVKPQEVDGPPVAKSLREEIENRLRNQRLTPAHRRIVQVLLDHASEIGFLSSQELASLANVSQPSVSRFAGALGFGSFSDMRKSFRSIAEPISADPRSPLNKYQAAALAEASNLTDLSLVLEDVAKVKAIGNLLASSRPLLVLGLRASAGFATQFCYFAAKVHPDVRQMIDGGSMIEDQIDQALSSGATTLLTFAMPLYPRETIRNLQYAKQAGLKIIVVSDPSFAGQGAVADHVLTTRINPSLVFDSSAASAVWVSILLDAMCDAMPERTEARLEQTERSSTRRKVFAV